MASPRSALAQVPERLRIPPATTTTDLERLTGWSIGGRLFLARAVDGEAFEGLGPGTGGRIDLGLEFDEGYRAGVAVGLVSHGDALADERAQAWELLFQFSWTRTLAGFRTGVGPIVGPTGLDRGIYAEPNVGLIAGGGINLSGDLTRLLRSPLP